MKQHQQKCTSYLIKKSQTNEPYNMISNGYLYHNGRNSFINIIYKTELIQVTKSHRKSSSMYHVLEAALNSMPQRSTSVRTLHKTKWHLGQANKLFENEKKKTVPNEYQDNFIIFSGTMQAGKLLPVIGHLSGKFEVLTGEC